MSPYRPAWPPLPQRWPWLLVASGLLFPMAALGAVPSTADAVTSTLGGVIEDAVRSSDEAQVSTTVRLIVLMTALSVLPGMLLLMTPFTRFIIVLSLLRQAMGLQQSPPNQVLVGLSLMMSLTIMRPTLEEVNTSALQPYLAGDIDTATFYDEGIYPMRKFMLRNTGQPELATSIRIARLERPTGVDDLPTPVIVTAFVLSEVKTAFIAAVKVYIPFLVVDLIVASSLLGMGMMMVPPVVIALPFKLLVFVLMDGWDLLILGLAASVR